MMVAEIVAGATLAGAGIAVALLWRRGRASPEHVSLREVARTVWNDRVDHQPAATLEIDVGRETAVYADRTELEGLLTALFENAVEHGPANDTVRLERTDDGFAVSDNGPGIPEDEREIVFEIGYAGEAGSDGLGLGLVNSVCESYGWTVSVTDSERGGARIEISGVEFTDDWQGTGSTSTPDETTATESDDTAYISGELSDESETTEDEWISPEN